MFFLGGTIFGGGRLLYPPLADGKLYHPPGGTIIGSFTVILRLSIPNSQKMRYLCMFRFKCQIDPETILHMVRGH